MDLTTQIEHAAQIFRTLLTEQAERALAMHDVPPRDYMKAPVRIGLIGGDGIGPLLLAQARRLLSVLIGEELAAGTLVLVPIGGLTIEHRLATGDTLPPGVLAEVKTCDVLLKGPTTTPKGGALESANVALRRELDLYANVRPVRVPEAGIDWVFFRENTEGEYTLGARGVSLPGALAVDFKVTTVPGTRRVARAAFAYARANGKRRVAIVTKANIMKGTDGLFSDIAHEVAADYPEITAEDWYVDIAAAHLIDPAVQADFQVFLLPNLYGDILTDEAAQLQGGVGTAGSANVGDLYAMFEPIHGSAPRMIAAGLGDYADPGSMFRAVEMLLRHIGRHTAADRLDRALNRCATERRLTVTGTEEGATTRAFTDYVLETLGAFADGI